MAAPLTIDTVERDGSLVLVVHGELDMATAGALDQALGEAWASEVARIVVDLDDVSFIDSTGLQVLIRHALGQPAPPRIRLTRGSRQAQRLFEISGAADYLPFVASEPSL